MVPEEISGFPIQDSQNSIDALPVSSGFADKKKSKENQLDRNGTTSKTAVAIKRNNVQLNEKKLSGIYIRTLNKKRNVSLIRIRQIEHFYLFIYLLNQW